MKKRKSRRKSFLFPLLSLRWPETIFAQIGLSEMIPLSLRLKLAIGKMVGWPSLLDYIRLSLLEQAVWPSLLLTPSQLTGPVL